MNIGANPGYARIFDARHPGRTTFSVRRSAYLDDRYGGTHLLGPVLDKKEWASFTFGRDDKLQAAWREEHGLSAKLSQDEILLRQIEDHRTDVFYNLDPMEFGSTFVHKLPGCVKYKLCWRASPSPGADFAAYDRVLCNFPDIRKIWRKSGCKTAPFFPAHDPELDPYAAIDDRPIDVSIAGTLSRHHPNRVAVLDTIAGMSDRYDIRYNLDVSRAIRIAEHPLLSFLPLGRYRRTTRIREASHEPVFGRDYYYILGNSKIVLNNGSAGIVGADRGNMRCFEAMGAGCLLVSDDGNYPPGMEPGRTMLCYSSPEDAADKITAALDTWEYFKAIADAGFQAIRDEYSKANQWQAFVNIIDGI